MTGICCTDRPHIATPHGYGYAMNAVSRAAMRLMVEIVQDRLEGERSKITKVFGVSDGRIAL
jgi:hypothetical protein